MIRARMLRRIQTLRCMSHIYDQVGTHHRAILEQETKLRKTVRFSSFVSRNPLISPHTQGSKIRASYIRSAQKEKNCLEAATTSTESRWDAPPQAPVCRQCRHSRQICTTRFYEKGAETIGQRDVSPPSTDHAVDDSPNLTLSDIRGVPLPAPSHKAPPHIPLLRIVPHTPATTSPQYTPSPSLPSHSSRRKSFTRSLPSYLEHGRPTHPQHGHCVIDGQGCSSMRHYPSAISSPYMNTAQLPYHDQAHPQHRDCSLYVPKVSPQPPLSSSQNSHSIPPTSTTTGGTSPSHGYMHGSYDGSIRP